MGSENPRLPKGYTIVNEEDPPLPSGYSFDESSLSKKKEPFGKTQSIGSKIGSSGGQLDIYTVPKIFPTTKIPGNKDKVEEYLYNLKTPQEKAYAQQPEQIASSGYYAKSIKDHPGFVDEPNPVNKLIKERANQYEQTTQPLRDLAAMHKKEGITAGGDTNFKGNIYDAAIKSYANQHPSFKDQLKAVGIDADNDSDLEHKIGAITDDNRNVLGKILSDAFNSKDFLEYIEKEQPDFFSPTSEVYKGLIKDNPGFGANQVANEVSQAIQKSGYNNIEPIFNYYDEEHKRYADTIAQNLYKNDPDKLKIWNDYVKDNQEKYIDAPSLMEGFASGVKGTAEGIKNTLTVPFESTPEQIKNQWKKEASNVSADPDGFMKFLRDSGHVLGMVSTIGATGNILGGGGAGFYSSRVVPTLQGTVPFFGDALQEATAKYPDSPVKAYGSALFQTTLYGLLAQDIFPSANIQKAFGSIKPEIESVSNRLAAGEITKQAAKDEMGSIYSKAFDFLGGTLKKDARITAELYGINKLNESLDMIMGLDSESMKKYHPEGNDLEMLKNTFLSNLPLGALSKFGEMRGNEDTRGQPKPTELTDSDLIQKSIDNGILKGMNAEMAKEALKTPESTEQLFKEVSDQALNKVAPDATSPEEAMRRARETYGDELVNKAIEKYPAEQLFTEGNKIPEYEDTQASIESTQPKQAEAEKQPEAKPIEAITAAEEPEKRTGIKNAVSDATRDVLELPKVDVPKLGTDSQILSEGKKLVDEGTIKPQEVVSRINSTDNHNMSRDESKAMQYYMHQLGRAEDVVRENLSKDTTPEEKASNVSKLQQLRDLQDAATEANKKAGKDWSDVGNIRQILVDQSFNPSREKADIKEAYGGEIPKDVQQRLDMAIKERDDAIIERNKLEEELRQKEAELQAAKLSKESKGQKTKTDFKSKRTSLKDQMREEKEKHDKWLRDNNIQQQGLGSSLTPKMLKLIGEYAKTYIDEGIQKLSEIIDKVYDDIKGYFPGIDKNDVRDAIAGFEAERLDTKATGLENKINSGNTEPPVSKIKLKFQKDSRWVKANQRVANAEYKIKQERKKALESEKSMTQRGFNWLSKLTRFSVLSGFNVLYKLAAAATVGGAAKRIPEQAFGAMWSQVFKGVAEKAPIEGFPNAKAEAKFYKEFFNPKKFVKNSWEIIKGNESDLTRRLGEPYKAPESTKAGKVADRILSFPTDLHQVIKDPVKRATFEASFKNGMVWAEKNGLDINNPLVINSIETAAYKRANYEIFLEKNWLTDKFNAFKAKMEKQGNIGAGGKFIADFLIPVSTVPTNIARRLLSTSPLGLIRGGSKVVEAYRKGIESLDSQQADAIMRQLKQGSLGTALWLIGWFGASHFGGLYSSYDPNKKRKEGELASDEMEINGERISKPIQHALPFEIIQWAATMRHIYDNYTENKGSNPFEATWKAGLGSIGALAEQVPIIETPVHLINAASDPYEGKKLEEDLKRRFEPQILRETGVVGNQANPLKKLKDKYVDSENIFKNDLEKTVGKTLTSDEFKKYKDSRDEKINTNIESLYNNGIGGKKFDELTDQEVRDEIQYIKTKATDDTKEEMFKKKVKTSEQKRSDYRRRKERETLYK